MQYGKRSRKGSRLFALVAMFLIVTMAAGQPLSEMRVYAAEGPVVEQPADTSGGQPDETAVNTTEPAPQENPASAPLDAQPAGGEDVPPQDVQPAGGEDVQPQDTQPAGGEDVPPQDVQPAGGEGAQTQDVQPEGGEGAQTQDTQPAGGDTPVPEAPAGDGTAAEDGSGAAAPGTDPAAEETAENENAADDDAQDPEEPDKSNEENSDEAESYIVEFSYNGLTYVMQGGSSVKLSEILAAVGLADGVENVTVSNDTLFSASNESGEWEITAHQAFFSAEWMKVTIGGIEYEITATGKKPEDAAAKEPEAEGPSASVEVRGFSKTKNIVGDVFVNWVNHANPELQERSLLEYPLDPHDRAYYGDSPRVRLLEGRDPSNPNYLVYRDSYLLISKEQSSQYTVTFSEDDTTAYVTPAIPAEELSGRTGVVFLAESVGYDNILVFGGEVSYDGDIAVIPLKKTDEITVNMLFSDGKLEVLPEDGMGQAKRRSFLKAKSGYTPPWENLSGKNWEGKITGFSAEWPTPGFGFNVWDLLFELTLTLSFDLDFDITTTGATDGREPAKVAGISIPIEGLFTVDLDYNLQVEFDETPIHVKGKLNTVFDYTLGTHGAQIREYKTPVEIKELNVLSPDGVDGYNEEINFYIGSQLAISGKVLYINLDLGLFSVKLGPVLDLAQDSHGGCYFTAIHEKDLLKTDPPAEGETDDRYMEIEGGRISGGGKLNFRDRNAAPDEIHTCTAEHEDGCLHLDSKEVQQNKITFTINLWFDDWEFDISDSGEKTIEEKEFYNSYTFNSGMKEGVCPHRFYKVPVNVWLDDEKTRPAPEGISVTVSDAVNVAACEEQFISATTDSNGKTLLFLPYKEEYKYTLIASGTIDGRSLTGSKRQRTYMKAGENEPVDIVLMPDEKTRVEANVIWNVDADGKDVPANSMVLVLQRREAGTDKPWEIAEDYELHNMSREIRKETGWRVEGWTVPKFGFESERAYLYEYRVRIRENNLIVDDPATEPFYGELYKNVDSYDNAAGLTEPAHSTHYRFSYSENVTDDVTTTTITGTAIMNVSVKKIWNLADPADKALFVYLALQQKPEFGWEDLAAAKGVPTDWVPILNPLSGGTTTLRNLIDEALLTTSDYIGEIENTPLTIGLVNNRSWILRYTVPKYRKGIQMQFEGCELDKNVIERLFQYEYDLNVMADVPSFGEYTSIPGLPADISDYEKSINVINTDPLEDGTLIGTVRWEMDHSGNEYLPDSVTLHIFKDGVEIPESPVTLQQANYSGLDTWIWTKKVQDYDPDAEYTVKEVLSNNNLEWVGVVSGLDVYNYRIWYDALQVEAQAVFEGEPAIENLHVSVRDKESEAEVWKFDLAKNQAWWDRDPNVKKSDAKDISQYELVAPDVDGYAKVYGEPYAYTRPGWGNLFYNFTVYYVKQSDALKLHISKEWENTDDKTVYPDTVKITVKRDGEVIAEKELSQDEETGEWSRFIVSQDKKGNPLSRLDNENRKYVYTIEEESVEGFTSKVRVTEDTGDDIYYTVTNTWAGADYVNAEGTVFWEGDEGKEYLRPETVKLSVVNAREEYVRTVEVPITFKENGNDEDNKKYTWEAKYLPGKDKDGSLLRYSVVESHVPGYAITYDKPIYDETTGKWSNFDETTRTWTCNLTNTLIGYFPLTIKKVIEGEAGDNDVYEFTVESKEQEDGTEREIPLPLNKDELKISSGKEKKEVTADFLFDEDGLYLYSIKEKEGKNENCTYDDTEKQVLIVRSSKRNPETGVLESSFKSWVGMAEKDGASAEMTPIDAAEVPAGGQIDGYYEKGNTVEFVNVYSNITIEKKWNIDLTDKDRPDSIEVVVQTKKDGKWENVRLVELSKDNGWKASVSASGEDFRVRELKPEETTIFDQLKDQLKGMITGALDDEYDSVISSIKSSEYYRNYSGYLPGSVTNAMDNGADNLKEALNATTGNLYDKLVEQLGLAALLGSKEDRVVYDKDDDGKPEGAETNEVTFSGGKGETKYRVEYDNSGSTYTITNTAIVDIDLIKRWLMFKYDDKEGVKILTEDDDMPDSAWVVLMFTLKPEELGGDYSDKLNSLAELAGYNISDLSSYEIPVFKVTDGVPFLLEGGKGPISIISELALGIDLGFLDNLIPCEMAIAKVDEDSNWRQHFVVSKYAFGIPVEFKGAELGSEVIRQIIKYVSGETLNLPVSYNPFDNYISVPMKAYPKYAGVTDPSDLLDVSGLTGKVFGAVKDLLLDPKTWSNISFESIASGTLDGLKDETDQMANVINIKVDWDTDEDPEPITGKKIWKDDSEEKRPETLTIHVKDGKKEIEGSPITLNKSDFSGENEWEWTIEPGSEETPNPDDLTVTEEFPENYPYKDHYTSETDGLDITNTWHEEEPETISISGKKIWKDDDNKDGIRPEKITVKLLADGTEVRSVETSKEGGWKYRFDNLPKYKEAEAAEEGSGGAEDGSGAGENNGTDNTGTGENNGTDNTGAGGNSGTGDTGKQEIVYTIEEVKVEGYETELDGFNLINTHEPETITIEGKKVWNDVENQEGKRPDAITIRLKADGKEVDSVNVTEAEDGSWTWKFEDQPKTNGGKDITYTISEDAVEGYTTEIEGDAAEGFTVTNTYEPGKTQVQVSKVWNDRKDQDGIRPDSVTMKLLADGSPATDENGDPLILVLSEENSWTGTFENLDASKDGKEIAYTVEEETDDVITGVNGEGTYSFRISGDAKNGFTVTNRHTPQTITVEGKKTWDDSENQYGKRPESIVIRLRADGEEVRSRTVTENVDWKWSFGGLPQYADGKEIEYTISEDNIPGYTSEIDEFDVTNTYTPGKTQVDVTKVWKDEDDRDGIRPKSVTIRLLADGAAVTDEENNPVTLVLSEGNKWTGSFKDLDQKKEDGKEIVYTVEEEPNDVITGQDGEGTYAFEVSGSMEKGFTVTNTHTPKTITVNGRKVWEDKEDQDDKRPDSITIRLLADGKEAGVKKVTEADGWVWSFEGLPEKADGKAITYTITEDVVEDYTSSVEGDAENGFTVTNTYTPGKTQVNVVKVWSDKDDQDGIRPTSVTVSLLAGGEETGKTLLLSEANNWSGSFTDLDAKQDGEPVSYTVEEKQTAVITGTDGRGTYGIEVTGDAEKGFKVRNTHTPEILTIGGTKVWNDAENQDKRPESITIRLKADGKDCVVRKVTAADDWKWSFEKLPKYDGEREIVYTLTEDAVPEYTTEISGNAQDGFTVTNTYDPGKTQVTVTKVWNDDNDHDKIRPDEVRVFLLENGEKAGKPVELSEKNNWTYTFSGLKTSAEDGEPIRYTVEEESRKVTTGTDGEGTYAVNITGTAAKGFTVTNTHTPQKVRISVNKVWDDGEDQDGLRKPIKSITVTLLADGKPAKDAEENPVTLSEKTGWKGEFTGLDKEKDGAPVEYTVEEKKTNVITGEDGAGTYAIAINGNTEKGFTITNTHTPETVSVEGEKTWDDKENQDGERPESITIRLLNDKNEKVASVKADAAGGWKWKFTDLPKYRNGSEIKYRVMEDAVDGYTATYEKPVFDKQNNVWTCDVTNTHTPGKTQVSVVKVWKDDLDETENTDDIDGIRPGSVEVKLLLKTGAPVLDEKNKPVTVVLSEKNGWSHTFTVDAKKDGEPITYMVEEEKTDVITGKDTMSTYAIAVTGDQKQGYTITNTHTPVRYTIIYDLDGGTYKGSPDDIIEIYPYGTKITIHEKPVKPGYEFQYWQGSTYQPGDKYTVTEDHKFTAVWEPVPTPTPTPTPTDGPTVTPVPGTPTSPPVKPIPGTPYGPGNTTSTLTGAKTGDNSHMIQWIIVLIAAAAALGGIGIYRKKRSAPDEK